MNKKIFLTKDRLGALLLLLLGLGVILEGSSYRVGDLTNMGAGYMPVVLGAALVVLGVVLLGTTWRDSLGERPELPDLRGGACILTGVVSFVVLGHYGGLVPATFAATFISALGDRSNSWRDAALLGLGMVAAAAIIFRWGLQMQFPLLSWGG